MTTLAWFLVSVPLAPVLLAAVKAGTWGRWLLPVATLPALVAAAAGVGVTVELPWMLLGMRWGIADLVTQVWLGVTALLWFCAALYSAASLAPGTAHAWRFRIFFLLTMSGNFLLTIAEDMGSFYLGFAAMGLAAYGLVVQYRSVTTTRAGRIYLVWTIIGEVALFAGMVLAVGATGSHYFAHLADAALPLAAAVLLTLGFGIKLALPGLHAWLPLAHGAAPPAISALLSGVMVKAGILGLLRFLPPGADASVVMGEALLWLGLTGAFYAVALGSLQHAPKVILAYSTMSQLGVLAAITGLVLVQADLDTPLLMGLLWYVVHHALVKGALFIGVGVFKHNLANWALAVLVLLALVLAGLPFGSGALAKAGVKAALPEGYAWMGTVLTASTVATSLLMGRFVQSLWRYRQRHTPQAPASAALPELLAWCLLLIAVFGWYWQIDVPSEAWEDALLPIVAGAALSAPFWWVLPARWVAVGDLPIWLARQGYALRRRMARLQPV